MHLRSLFSYILWLLRQRKVLRELCADFLRGESVSSIVVAVFESVIVKIKIEIWPGIRGVLQVRLLPVIGVFFRHHSQRLRWPCAAIRRPGPTRPNQHTCGRVTATRRSDCRHKSKTFFLHSCA